MELRVPPTRSVLAIGIISTALGVTHAQPTPTVPCAVAPACRQVGTSNCVCAGPEACSVRRANYCRDDAADFSLQDVRRFRRVQLVLAHAAEWGNYSVYFESGTPSQRYLVCSGTNCSTLVLPRTGGNLEVEAEPGRGVLPARLLLQAGGTLARQQAQRIAIPLRRLTTLTVEARVPPGTTPPAQNQLHVTVVPPIPAGWNITPSTRLFDNRTTQELELPANGVRFHLSVPGISRFGHGGCEIDLLNRPLLQHQVISCVLPSRVGSIGIEEPALPSDVRSALQVLGLDLGWSLDDYSRTTPTPQFHRSGDQFPTVIMDVPAGGYRHSIRLGTALTVPSGSHELLLAGTAIEARRADLLRRVHFPRISVQGPGGSSLPHPQVSLGNTPCRANGAHFLCNPTDQPRYTINVTAPGYRTASVQVASGPSWFDDTSVTLRALPRLLRIEFDGLHSGTSAVFTLSLRPTQPPASTPLPVVGQTNGSLLVFEPTEGVDPTQRWEYQIRRDNGVQSGWVELGGLEPGEARQVFHIPLPHTLAQPPQTQPTSSDAGAFVDGQE